MAATDRLSGWRRLRNRVVSILLRVGLAPRHTSVLTVRGRRPGTRSSIPVTLVEVGTPRWLVAPDGEVAWVRKARAAGQVTLSRGRRAHPWVVNRAGVAPRLCTTEVDEGLGTVITPVPVTAWHPPASPHVILLAKAETRTIQGQHARVNSVCQPASPRQHDFAIRSNNGDDPGCRDEKAIPLCNRRAGKTWMF